MEVIRLGVKYDDREEGEIVDDDFEDISDSSISVPVVSGKSVSSKEHLPAISLSSVTDVEEAKSENKVRRRHKPARRKCLKCHRKRRNSLRKPAGSDSDSDDYQPLDKRLQKQIKDAIRRDDTEDRHQNSLRTRLRGMTKLGELEVEPDSCAEKNCKEKVERKESSDEGDTELAQLRLEALRTAVLNKFMHRKKRKVKAIAENEVLSDDAVKTDNSETNKENKQNAIENCSKKLCVEIPVQNEHKAEIKNTISETISPEEDEDVLRALLLASMSKKITSETKKITGPLTNNGKQHILQNGEKKELIGNPKIHANKNITNTKVQLPIVKPLVINLNGDSDSDDDLFNKTVKKTEDEVTTTQQKDLIIESSVEKFLKEQRAKVEAQLSPIPKGPIKPKNSSVIHEKSCVKLLPKVKQLEYQKLLQKLKTAERKSRMRKLALKPNNGGKPITFSSKKIIRTKLPYNKQVSALKFNPVPDMSSEVQTLHKIFKDIQDPNTGRLQIQEKYNILRPAIKRVNEASEERRKKEEEYKRLIQEVEELKVKLANARKNFSIQVNNLVQQKERIDKSMAMEQAQPIEVRTVQYTSTPIKQRSLIVSIETCLPNTTSKNVVPLPENVSTEANLKGNLDTLLNPGDPNDIDRIYNVKKNFPKYVSPLDNVKRVATDDPFSIICPYDVDGNCRDPGCIYKHFSK